jgi:hypothetical protein
MLREIFILLSCGSVGYAWLCAVTSPVVRAIASLVSQEQRVGDANRARRRSGARESVSERPRGEAAPERVDAWLAVALAAGAAVLWTAIIAAAILLSMMLVPRAGLALLGSHLFWPGIGAGAAVWLGQLAARIRVPRFSDDVEAAAALAIVALVDDSPETLTRVHHLYASYAIGPRNPRRLRLDGSRPAAAA